MPEIPVGSQIFDVVFHPSSAIAYTGLLNGHIKAFAYGEQGDSHNLFSLRPSKRSCRGLSLNGDGSKLYAVGKSKALHIVDTTTTDIDARSAAHDCAINRVKSLMPWVVATGDDDGTVKLWDPRKRDSVKTYTQHFDYISDFLWLDDKKQLVATSGDGTLSVMDVRAKEPKVVAQSEDQEDDLLSIVAIKSAQKILVGTQLGILSVFNRKKGWGDCVDRIPGHPLSIDTLCNIPDDIPDTDPTSTVLTGSSDGFVRVVQILPTKFLGVVADHGEFPVERIAVGGGRYWVGSVGHDEVLRMTDLGAFFHENHVDSDEEEDDEEEWGGIEGADGSEGEEDEEGKAVEGSAEKGGGASSDESDDEDEEMEPQLGDQSSKRKRQPEVELPDPSRKSKKGKKETVIDKDFFDGL
uniref:WD repeat-containing protein JIP5 n=1 Tax=Coprinopsis cinerea (strain Okayama-7 / 130 / ATCC MYA-4618 / FGSC 9003) TaxID=240176 RepID=JIP5_COPC7|nr:RecName: Full=WD repeat-containing protein JIP5 [Coprinopsis cinerea okayama7\